MGVGTVMVSTLLLSPPMITMTVNDWKNPPLQRSRGRYYDMEGYQEKKGTIGEHLPKCINFTK